VKKKGKTVKERKGKR